MVSLPALLLLPLLAVGFTPPDEATRKAAAGSLDDLGPAERRAFTDGGEFKPKRKPGAIDWLAAHEEKGQTFDQYARSGPNLPRGRRTRLYVLPLGRFESKRAPSLKKLRDSAAAHFHPLEVRMLPPVPEARVRTRPRIHGGHKQWNSRDILRWMESQLPADAYAMIAVTMTDLYPEDSWNFVFGQASTRQRVGVFSFARYHPAFTGGDAGPDTEALVLRRAAKVLTHEMGHMFGIRHCIHYECLMNGANHLAEADRTPMHLCPVCLRKLAHACRFDAAERYGKLERFYDDHGFTREAGWTRRRLKALGAAAR